MREGRGRTAEVSLTAAVFWGGHIETLAHGHVPHHGAPVGPSAASRAGVEKADTSLTHVSTGMHIRYEAHTQQVGVTQKKG